MIRIRTKVGDGRVFTLYFIGKWVTLINDGNRTSSMNAESLALAGDNHLTACVRIKEIMDDRRRRLTSKLLNGSGHPWDNSSGISDSSTGADREGINGDGGSKWCEAIPTNPSSPENQNTSEFGSGNTELINNNFEDK
jgi:hypothetical protein